MNKIDITSTALEKALDSAKEFLGKLLLPAIEETGLLIKDQVTLWKFKNQIKMLNKARVYCEKNNINPKTISLKLLVPLLENSALEEDEDMQNKWAILLSNLVDSEQNIENHVFPYILSQLSSGEFYTLELTFENKQKKIQGLQKELDEFRLEVSQKELEINKRIGELPAKIAVAKLDKNGNRIMELEKEKSELEKQLKRNTIKEATMMYSIKRPESLPFALLQEYEESNLIRLGLIKEVKEFYANSQTLEIPIDPGAASYETGYVNLDLDVDVESNTEIVLTELGELFISACKEKSKKIS